MDPEREADPDDVAPLVAAALRDILGFRPRATDPQAFEDALRAAFDLRSEDGHVEVDYVSRGYAVQTDLGAVTGGQAALYRRAIIALSGALRILDELDPLGIGTDLEDSESYSVLVRDALERLVDEDGAGQLGALRDRFGLADAGVNSIEEEDARTAFWVLIELITEQQSSSADP
jgi:hypothetical protein